MQIGNTGPSLNALPNYMYIKQKINSHYRFKYKIKYIIYAIGNTGPSLNALPNYMYIKQ